MSGLQHGSFPEVQVPSGRLWGVETQRSLEHFRIGPPASMPLGIIHAYALVKKAAALANRELGGLSEEKASAIASVCDEIAAGQLDDHFPLVVWQTGSGTHTNMNLNEVIANRAGGLHPLDDVNRSQSSNDTFPTAMHLAACRLLAEQLLPALEELQEALERKGAAFRGVLKVGRTHLMDAVPMRFGQEFSAYAAQLGRAAAALRGSLDGLAELPLGGTAVGTGLNTPGGWRPAVVTELGATVGLALSPARNAFEAQAARDSLVELSGQLRTVAVSLTKISEDIRWKASGPAGGLGEFALPPLQAGSSIMPGKVNPVIPEVVVQVCAQVVGNDAAVAWAGARGAFELNAMIPVIARNLLASIQLLTSASRLLADRCVAGIEVDQDRTRALAESSAALITALNPYLGYTEAAAIVKEASQSGRSVRELAERHVPERLSKRQLDEALDLDRIARPHHA